MKNLFKFDGAMVRVFVINGETLFSGIDVAKALGYVKPERALEQHTKKGVKYKKSEHPDLGGMKTPKYWKKSTPSNLSWLT